MDGNKRLSLQELRRERELAFTELTEEQAQEWTYAMNELLDDVWEGYYIFLVRKGSPPPEGEHND